MKQLLPFLLLFLPACSQNAREQSQSTSNADPKATSVTAEQCMLANHALAAAEKSTPEALTQAALPKQISLPNSARVILTVKEFKSSHYPTLGKTADSALYIASVLLNSQEFQDSISRLTFTCRNFKINCKKHCANNCDARFEGKVVLDSAYRKKNVAIKLLLDNENNGSFGSAAMNVNTITSHYPVIRADDRTLPFSYSYAYHIGHEYMHIVGFTHQSNKDDVAYRVGVTGYRIIRRWHKAKINPMAIKL